MAADIGNFTDMLFLIGIAGYIAWLAVRKKPEREVHSVKKKNEERDKATETTPIAVNPVINIIFQADIEEEELTTKIADLYLSGRTYYYTGKAIEEGKKEQPHFIRFKEVEWGKLEKINT